MKAKQTVSVTPAPAPAPVAPVATPAADSVLAKVKPTVKPKVKPTGEKKPTPGQLARADAMSALGALQARSMWLPLASPKPPTDSYGKSGDALWGKADPARILEAARRLVAAVDSCEAAMREAGPHRANVRIGSDVKQCWDPKANTSPALEAIFNTLTSRERLINARIGE